MVLFLASDWHPSTTKIKTKFGLHIANLKAFSLFLTYPACRGKNITLQKPVDTYLLCSVRSVTIDNRGSALMCSRCTLSVFEVLCALQKINCVHLIHYNLCSRILLIAQLLSSSASNKYICSIYMYWILFKGHSTCINVTWNILSFLYKKIYSSAVFTKPTVQVCVLRNGTQDRQR